MIPVEILSMVVEGEKPSLSMTATVRAEDTVGAMVENMPMVAATPYLVTLAEIACFRLIARLLDAGQISVGRHVAIDHLGPSQVGATLKVDATLIERGRTKFICDVAIHDGDRLVATVRHVRIAIPRQEAKAD